LRMSEISDKNVFSYLWILEMFFSIFDFIFSNVPSMSLISLSICEITVDDLAFFVTSWMGRNSLQWRWSSVIHIAQQGSPWIEKYNSCLFPCLVHLFCIDRIELGNFW
jgi:hypothetical protein